MKRGRRWCVTPFLLPPKQNFYSLEKKIQDEILVKEEEGQPGLWSSSPVPCTSLPFLVSLQSLFLCPFFFILFPAFLFICLSFPDFHLIPWFSSEFPLFCTKLLTTKKSAQSERNRSRRLMLILMGHKIMKRRRRGELLQRSKQAERERGKERDEENTHWLVVHPSIHRLLHRALLPNVREF